jgi:hypothetical protein
MKTIISDPLRSIEAKVQKGDIRNTILRQIKTLEKAKKLLSQGRAIKDDEIDEYRSKKPAKTKILKKQVSIITQGLKHIMHAIKELDRYKKTSIT